MRPLFRSNSFGSRLLAGSASFYLGIIGFLVVLLAISVQHTFRLNNQIERLHWQLALSQLLRTVGTPERPLDLPANMDNILRTQGAEDNLLKLIEQLKDVLDGQQSKISNQQNCSQMPVDDVETEKGEEELSLMRLVVGFGLIVAIAACVYVWYDLDRLKDVAPNAVVQRCLPTRSPQQHLSHVLAYKIDLWFSTNKYAKVLALFFFTVLLVAVGSLALFSVSDVSLYEAFWGSLAGVGIDWTFSEGFSASSGFLSIIGRLVSMMISLGGLLVTALLLGIVSEIISDKVDDMKKGTSDVLESEHTLILGWSDEMVPIIRQICLANESIGGSSIVILSEREKEEMEADIMRNDIDFKGSKIICRSGNPLLKHDLDKVSVHAARSIIVLANQQSPDQSDARVLRVILSLVAFHETGGLQGYVVAELCDMDNEPLVKLVGGSLVQTVVSHDIIGRLMIQCALQPGLAAVYDEIMGFEGCEFYLEKWSEITGKTFKQVLLSFPDAVPIGFKDGRSGRITLNAADDYVMQEDDKLIVLAEDEDTYKPSDAADITPGLCPAASQSRRKEKILFLGWRRDMDDMITVLDTFVEQGSELWLYNEVPIKEREQILIQGGLDPDRDLRNLVLRYKDDFLKGDLITRKQLEALDPASFSSILILADESATGEDIADADSRNLATLLLLRDIMRGPVETELISRGSENLERLRQLTKTRSVSVVVSEILDARTRNLIKQLNISEFVLSNEIVSMTLAMVAESADVNCVLQELFSEQGAEFYIRPAEEYLQEGEVLSFFDLIGRCRQRQEIPIGFQTSITNETCINPPDKHLKNLTLADIETIVILAD